MWWLVLLFISLTLTPKIAAQEPVRLPPVFEVPIHQLEKEIKPDRDVPQKDQSISRELPLLGNQQYVLKNGDPEEKLDILFIPWRMTDITQLPTLIEKLLYVNEPGPFDGLFQFVPFSENQQKFNVSFIDKNIDEAFFECFVEEGQPGDPLGSYLYHECNDHLVKEGYARFQPDYIVIIFDLPIGYHSTGGEIMYLESDAGSENDIPELENYVAWVFVHEFAHQFGGLADEYIRGTGTVSYYCGYDTDPACFDRYYQGIEAIPNLDKAGCPKWCTEYNLQPLIDENSDCGSKLTKEECLNDGDSLCTWFTNPHPVLGKRCVVSSSRTTTGLQCMEKVTCNLGADYAPLAFRPEEASLMNGGEFINTPSEQHLSKALECCYPKSDTAECQRFRESLASPNPETNYHLAKALRKIGNCPAIGECQRSLKALVESYSNSITCPGFDANLDDKLNVLDIAYEM